MDRQPIMYVNEAWADQDVCCCECGQSEEERENRILVNSWQTTRGGSSEWGWSRDWSLLAAPYGLDALYLTVAEGEQGAL